MADGSDELAWALAALKPCDRYQAYTEARSYYDNGRPTNGRLESLGTKRFREVFGDVFNVADNLCGAVVDSVADRLKVEGIDDGVNPQAGFADAAWEIWRRNRMDVRAKETHLESLLTGDGFALVWPDQVGEAVIWSLPADQMAVSYDPAKPGRLRRAARAWTDDDNAEDHLDIFLPDFVFRYKAERRRKATGLPTESGSPLTRLAAAVKSSARHETVIEANPWGVVPVVHFPNRAYHRYGVSELNPVVPLQRALNKTLLDMMVAQEFSAFRQRWATGLDPGDVDEETGKPVNPTFEYGQDRMLTSENPETKFGSFDASDITQYVEVLENHRAEIARVSGTPLHYLFITKGDFPSGEAMKSAEARFTIKVEDRQTSFGNQWEDLLALALRIEGAEDATPSMLSVAWKSAEPTGLTEKPASGPPPQDPPATPAA